MLAHVPDARLRGGVRGDRVHEDAVAGDWRLTDSVELGFEGLCHSFVELILDEPRTSSVDSTWLERRKMAA